MRVNGVGLRVAVMDREARSDRQVPVIDREGLRSSFIASDLGFLQSKPSNAALRERAKVATGGLERVQPTERRTEELSEFIPTTSPLRASYLSPFSFTGASKFHTLSALQDSTTRVAHATSKTVELP